MIFFKNILLNCIFIFIFGQLSQSIIDTLPIYNPSTRCHDLTFIDQNLTFAICLQRASNKQHPFNLYTSPSFCSLNYPPNGHLIDLISLPNSIIEQFLQNLIDLFNSKNSFIDLPEPNFLWINSSNITNLTENQFWCPDQCQSKNPLGKFLILKLRCQYNNNNNNSKPCLTIKHTHWDRAPFICQTNQIIIKEKKQISSAPIRLPPSYSNNTIVFYDSTPCVIVRTNTHEYTFCFRRQLCPQSQTSAFCTTKYDALHICEKEKHHSNLLTIENHDEYQLINDIIHYFSNQTLLNIHGSVKNKYIQRAQWMWIDGIKNSNDIYQWNISDHILIPISDKYWCNNLTNCSGGKGREHVVLNIVCRTNKTFSQICLASRRQSEPGPFICKRTLKSNETPITNYTYLKDIITRSSSLPPAEIITINKFDSISIYYDEEHCLTVQTSTHLYTFCFRRQTCPLRQAYCTKWTQAQKNCQILKNQAQLLTIDNQQEQLLITDIVKKYFNETRLTFNGSSYRYFQLADFLWIDGIQQANNGTYLWKNRKEIIPEHLWCPKNQCTSIDRPRVMLNLLCQSNNSLICLGTRLEWKPAPYVCKRQKPQDICPILFEKIRLIKSNEMLIITVNRTISLIKCKHPEYNTEIKIKYQCNNQTKQWNLIYENKNFTCPDYKIPPMPISTSTSQPSKKLTMSTKKISTTSTRPSYITIVMTSTLKEEEEEEDCSQTDLSIFINRLPTKSNYIYPQKFLSQSPLYYDMRLTCYFNNLIHITYRCNLINKQWIYVYGHTNRFQQCYPLCSQNERNDLLNKFFTLSEQTKIRTIHIKKRQLLRLRCFNPSEQQWKSINYKCGTMTLTKYQWFKLHSCFQSSTTTTTILPPVMVSMAVTQLPPISCPSSAIQSTQCPYEIGQFIFDTNGCLRKVCPLTSQLCNTIRCPPDRICRVIPCKSCHYTDYLQAVCEYRHESSLCEFEKQLLLLNDNQSINRWERQIMAIVQRYADEQRQRLKSSWPILTIN